MVVFNEPWYAEMIERFSPDREDDNGNAGRAVLAGFCILSQSIDELAKKFSADTAIAVRATINAESGPAPKQSSANKKTRALMAKLEVELAKDQYKDGLWTIALLAYALKEPRSHVSKALAYLGYRTVWAKFVPGEAE